MTNDSIDAKGTRAKALGARARGHEPWDARRKTSDVNACWGLVIVATRILNIFFYYKMPNDTIDVKGTRAKALGTRGRESASLGRKGTRPLMSMHASGWEL